MVNRIVIPLDGSDLALTAIPFGVLIARVTDAEIVVIHVAEERDDLQLIGINEYLSNLGDRFPMLPAYTQVVRAGDPAAEIPEFAGTAGTIIVMATHGAGGIRRMLLGNVADAVVQQATVPVALIRGVDAHELSSPALNRLLVPLDGSEFSNQALPVAIDLAACSQAGLHLLRVVEPLPADQAGYLPDAAYMSPTTYAELMADVEAAARDDLQLAAQICRDGGIDPAVHIIVSTPIDGILRTAKSIAADAIVMATHGRSGIRRVLLGSIATGLIQTSDTPLIVVPVQALAGSATEEGGEFDAHVMQEAGGVT
jgi:nucleotide-binding universal stress UspA family protein